MVPHEVRTKDRSLGSEVRVRLDAEGTRLRRSERRFGVDDPVETGYDARLDLENRFRDEKVVRKVEVLNVSYCASLSRISRSSSIIPRRRSLNPSSERRAAI